MEQMIPQKQRHPGLAALIEVGILFLPGIPAFFWLWPNVRGSSWDTAVNIMAYLYMLAGGLWIGLRRWSLAQLGFNRKGLGLGLICGLVLLAGRTLVILAVEWPAHQTRLPCRGWWAIFSFTLAWWRSLKSISSADWSITRWTGGAAHAGRFGSQRLVSF